MAVPYTVTNGDILETTVRYTVGGQTCLNIVHHRLGGISASQPSGVVVMNEFNDMFDNQTTGASARLSVALTSDCTINEIVHQWVRTVRFARKVFTPHNPAGNYDPPTIPANSDVTVVKQTEVAGKGSTGMIHVSGLATSVLTATRIAQEAVDLIDAYAGVLLKEYSLTSPAATLTPIIYHRAMPAASQEVTGWHVNPEPRTMRRRGLRLGI